MSDIHSRVTNLCRIFMGGGKAICVRALGGPVYVGASCLEVYIRTT